MGTTIDDARLFFYDTWPGPVRFGWKPAEDSSGNIFTNSTHHNVVSAVYEVGFKVGIKDSTTATYASFIYLQLGTQSGTLAAKDLCAPQITSSAFDQKVTNLASATPATPGCCAVALSAMTNDYFGWFFCGGFVPVGTVSALDGNFTTDDSVTASQLGLVADTVWKLKVSAGAADAHVAMASSGD